MISADSQARQIEERRKIRERAYRLALLGLLNEVRSDSKLMLKHHQDVASPVSTLMPEAADIIARSMAISHRDAFDLAGKWTKGLTKKADAGSVEDLAKQYQSQAHAATDAMIASLLALFASAGTITDVAQIDNIFQKAGYSSKGDANLKSGATRNVVAASNAGMLSLAQGLVINGQGVGIKHHTVDDGNETDICRDRIDLVRAATDLYWQQGNIPGLHYGCRSMLTLVFPPYTPSDWLPSIPSEPGFGYGPLPQFIRRQVA